MEQVTVSSPETGGEYVPVADRPVIARGIGPEPVEGLWIRLRVAPDWVDAPGFCEGLLHLIPIVPDHVATEVPDPRLGGAGEGGGKVREHGLEGAESAGDSTQVQRPPAGGGIEAAVPVELTIGGLTWILTSESEFHIHADAGPDLYPVEPDLELVVASNEGYWELRLLGTPFTTGDKEIELERMIWALVGPGGEPGPWTVIGFSNLLMSGTGERGVFPATFLLALATNMQDPAGDYVSEITLVASPG
jgi:hypothetical protein